MATLTVTQMTPNSSLAGSIAALVVASSSNGDVFTNTGRELVLFQNSSSQGGGTAVTVTVAAQQVDNYGAAASTHNITITVPSSSMGLNQVGPFRPSLYNNASGQVQLTYSAAGLSVAVISIAAQS